MELDELDVIALAEDLPEHGLHKGDEGTIVLKFTIPYAAYEVEFVDSYGRTVAEPVLMRHQFVPTHNYSHRDQSVL